MKDPFVVTVPLNIVLVILAFPKVAVFEPAPVVPWPITIWFVSVFPKGVAWYPISTELLIFVIPKPV